MYLDNDPGTETRLQSEITGNGTLSSRLEFRYLSCKDAQLARVRLLTRVRVELAGIRNDTLACLAKLWEVLVYNSMPILQQS